MGRLYEKPPHASETRDFILNKHAFKHDARGHEFEWHIGDEQRFKTSFKWITEDQIWWGDDYVENPKPVPRIEIRKWVERHLENDVMVEEARESVKYVHDPKKEWSYTWRNRYWIEFHFESDEDLTHFLIRWA